MYCRKCKYDLHAIACASVACPECGRAFDRDDARTWEPVPSQPNVSLAILVGAFVTLVGVEFLLGFLGPSLPVVVGDMGWLLAIVASIGAVASGWYAERRVALLVYGGLCSIVLLYTLSEHGFAAVLLWRVSPITQSAICMGMALALMFGMWVVGRLTWTLRIRSERLRRERVARGEHAWRRWPRPRTLSIWIAIVLALTLAWAANETRMVMYGTRNQAVDYDAEITALCLAAAGVDPEDAFGARERSAETVRSMRDLYRAAIRAIMTLDTPRRRAVASGSNIGSAILDFRYVLMEDRVPPDIEYERRTLAAMHDAGLFAASDRLGDATLGAGGVSAGGGLWFIRVATLARVASMRLAADTGDFETVVQTFEEIMKVTRVISYEGSTKAHRFAGSLRYTALAELRRELMEYEFPESACLRLLDITRGHSLAPAELALECDRLHMRGDLARRFTDNGRGNGYRFNPKAIAMDWRERIRDAFDARFARPSRRAEAAAGDAAIDASLDAVERPIDAASRPRDRAAEHAVALEVADPYLVASGPIMDSRRFVEAEAQQRLDLETTRLVIALALHRARHGRHPDTLTALVPEILPDLPLDPTTGTPYRYRRLDDDPYGRPFIMYSDGPNGIDDGGAYDENPRYELAPAGDNLDTPLTRPRHRVR